MIEESEIEDVKRVVEDNHIDIIAIESVERDINPNRDKYC